MIDFKKYNDEKLDQLRVDVLTEQERRANLAHIPEQITELAAQGRQIGVNEQTMVDAVTKRPDPESE